MSTFYEIKAYPTPAIEVESLEARHEVVRNLIEAGHDHILVVTWVRDFDGRARSCAATVYENGVERGVNIH